MLKNRNKGFTLVELLAVIVVLAIIALIGYTIVGDVISGAQESADKENVREYARSVRLAITTAQMNGNTVNSTLSSEWLSDNVNKTGNEVVCNSVINNNGTVQLNGCEVIGGSNKKYCYDGSNVTTCTQGSIAKIYGTESEVGEKTINILDKSTSKIDGIKNGLSFKSWGGVAFDHNWVVSNLRPEQTYTISYDVEVIEVPEYDKQDGKRIGFLLFGGTGIPSFSLAIDEFKTEGNFFNIRKVFTTPSTLHDIDYKMHVYTNRYIKSDVGVSSTVIVSNLQIVEGDFASELNYEPYGYKITITATPSEAPVASGEDASTYTIVVYIGNEKLGADDYLSYDSDSKKWYVVRNGNSIEVTSKGEVPTTGSFTYSATGIPESNFVYDYE